MLSSFLAKQYGGRGNVFAAYASITSLAAYTSTAGVGGPLLWNGSAVGGGRGVTAFLLALGYGLTVADTVAGAIGITGNSGQAAAPTTTTAITAVGNLNFGGPAPACSVYNVGTVGTAGSTLLVTGQVDTGALTTETADDNFIHLGGLPQVVTGSWAAVAASAALTSAVLQICLVWIEIPND